MTDAIPKPTPLELRDLLTFARYIAKKHVKDHWRSQGIKLSEWSMCDLRIASEQYLADHWPELRPKAEQYLAYSKRLDEARRRVRKVARNRTLSSKQVAKVEEAQS
jgi:hypothetical protein